MLQLDLSGNTTSLSNNVSLTQHETVYTRIQTLMDNRTEKGVVNWGIYCDWGMHQFRVFDFFRKAKGFTSIQRNGASLCFR